VYEHRLDLHLGLRHPECMTRIAFSSGSVALAAKASITLMHYRQITSESKKFLKDTTKKDLEQKGPMNCSDALQATAKRLNPFPKPCHSPKSSFLSVTSIVAK
jgi:hypothetical protein